MLNSRSGSQGNSSASQPPSIEVVRRRARHRLIGAAVLVLLGVLGFPLLFDTEPRPVSGDVPIEIPARGEVSSLAKAPTEKGQADTTAKASPAPAVAASKTASAEVTAKDSLDDREVVEEAVAKPAPVVKTPPKDTANAAAEKAKLAEKEAQAAAAAKAKAAKAAEAARAEALLENKDAAAPAAAGNQRLVIQVGAFAEPKSAHEARMKLERAGFKTYTHVAETPSGKLIRVRVGPYPTRAEADKMAAKVQTLGLPARILSL